MYICILRCVWIRIRDYNAMAGNQEVHMYIRRQYGKTYMYVKFRDMWSKAMKEDEPEGRSELIFRIVRLIMVHVHLYS